MTAVLFDFATRADYRTAVKTEFDGIKALFGEYQTALKKTYTVPAGTLIRSRSSHFAPGPARLYLSGEAGARASVRVAERADRHWVQQLVCRRGTRRGGSVLNAGRCGGSPGITGSPAK